MRMFARAYLLMLALPFSSAVAADKIPFGAWGTSPTACAMHANPESASDEFAESGQVITVASSDAESSLSETHGTCVVDDSYGDGPVIKMFLSCSVEGDILKRSAILGTKARTLTVFEDFGESTVYKLCKKSG